MTIPDHLDVSQVPAEVFLRARMLLTAAGPGSVGSKLWTAGMPLPYRTVRRLAGPLTPYGDEPLMRVHTFAATYSAAAIEAAKTDANILALVEYPGWDTTLPSGLVVHCDWAEITEAAHEEPYGAESVVTRFVSEYRFSLSLVPA
ncbi:hypothetical protein [Mycolicibacterium llatzerense]|uniref:hypothetical protein n=1 Tax=Mycolicibacterium llatzerense TaxID=280871 RepID=UPI0021B55BDA|nr:hypothetical protein [Mycolicibacterium llatzerense]MCT7372935.1 hypothetical protein [Mycolicibacterium llatzerense]